MSKSETLRASMNERLTAAAEEIFALFEKTMAEYEEELCRSKEENQRTQQRLEEILSTRVMLPESGAGVHVPSRRPPPGPSLQQELMETATVKEEPEEHGVKQEEEQLPVSESSAVSVKIKEPLVLQQRQTKEYKEATWGEAIKIKHTEHCFDDFNNDWEAPLSLSAVRMETEADRDHYSQAPTRDRSTRLSSQLTPAPVTSSSVQSMDTSVTDQRAERKKHQCSICTKQFWTKQDLQRHIRVHTGERPYSCSICQKTFALKGALNVHRRRHADKPCNCPVCNKEFTNSCNLKRHIRTHTGEKPYSCSLCSKEFNQSSNLKRHMRIHLEEKAELNTKWVRNISSVHVPF